MTTIHQDRPPLAVIAKLKAFVVFWAIDHEYHSPGVTRQLCTRCGRVWAKRIKV